MSTHRAHFAALQCRDGYVESNLCATFFPNLDTTSLAGYISMNDWTHDLALGAKRRHD
jgi:hypothetical protein